MAQSGKYLIVTDVPRSHVLNGLAFRGADEYLEGKADTVGKRLFVINLCRSYQYLSKGYYVSLLAHARQHHVLPTLEMIEEINNPFAYFRALQDAGIETIDFKIVKGRGRRLLPKVIVLEPSEENGQPDRPGAPVTCTVHNHDLRYSRARQGYVETTCVFGKTLDKRFRRQCAAVHRVYPFPLLRMRMYEEKEGWRVGQIFPVALPQLTEDEVDLLAQRVKAQDLGSTAPRPGPPKVRIACLWDRDDPWAPSNEETIEKLLRVAARQRVVVDVIGRADLPKLAEYDALFIRTVTAIDNYAFTFSKVAESLGIPVIDDPQSIIRCSNKVYLYELFRKNGIPTPLTQTIARRSVSPEIEALGFPLIVKLPDGTFSQNVRKVRDADEFQRVSQEMLKSSPLIIVQEFIPTPYDWRVCTLDGSILFVCKYHMARDHWQIAKRSAKGRTSFGRVEAIPNDEVPGSVSKTALDAASLIGRGLYGVDVKETANGPVVVEVNDNPNIEAGYEDGVHKNRIYDQLIAYFLRRIEEASRAERHHPD